MARGFWRQRAPSLTQAHDLKCQRLLNALNVGFILLKHRNIVFNPTPSCKIPIVRRLQNLILLDLYTRGGIEDIRLEAKAKDTKKNPMPRPWTAFPRTDTLEAKDRNARGQGPRKQAQVLSKKKFSKKFFKHSTKF